MQSLALLVSIQAPAGPDGALSTWSAMRDTIVGTAILVTLYFVGRYLIARDRQAKEQGDLFVKTLREIQTACDAEHRAQASQFLAQIAVSAESFRAICDAHAATTASVTAKHADTVEGLCRRFDAQGARIDSATSEVAKLTERIRAAGVIRE